MHVVVRNPRARAIVTERSGLRGLDEKRWEGKMIWEPLDVVVCRPYFLNPASEQDLDQWLQIVKTNPVLCAAERVKG